MAEMNVALIFSIYIFKKYNFQHPKCLGILVEQYIFFSFYKNNYQDLHCDSPYSKINVII